MARYTVTDAVDDLMAHAERVEAILRANQMHEGTCAYFKAKQASVVFGGVYLTATECDCWLAEPVHEAT